MKTRVRATVTVEIEIPGKSSWNDETSIAQIRSQALDDFNHTIDILNQPSIVNDIKQLAHKIQIINKPKVHMIITDEDN